MAACFGPAGQASLRAYLCKAYVAAIVAFILAWIGMLQFSQTNAALKHGVPMSFSTAEFGWFMAFVMLPPLAFILFVSVAGNVAAMRGSVTRLAGRLVLALTHALAFAVLAVLAYSFGGYDVLQCGIIACIDGVHGTAKSTVPSPYFSWVGAVLVLVFGALAALCSMLAWDSATQLLTQRGRQTSSLSDSAPTPLQADALHVGAISKLFGASTLPASSTMRMEPNEDTQQDVELREARRRLSAHAHAAAGRLSRTSTTTRRGSLIGFLFLALPMLWFCTSAFPNTWDHWTAAEGAEYAAKEIFTPYGNQTYCDAIEGRCPEYTYAPAIFRTTSLPIGAPSTTRLWLKIYPDVRMYYAAFYVATLIGVLSAHTPRLRRLMHARWALPWPLSARPVGWLVPWLVPGSDHGVVALSNLLLASGVWLLISIEVAYWWGAHDLSNKTTETSQLWARRLGQIGNVLLGLLALPVARNSIWAEALGVSWEVGISLHKVLGYAFLSVGLAHAGFWWSTYAQAGTFPHDAYAAPTYWPLDGHPISAGPIGDDFTIPTITYVFYMALFIFGVLTLETVRRNRFELFYYSHHFALVVYVAVLWHAASAWYFVVPSIVLYAADRALRFRAATREVTTTTFTAHNGGVTHIAFRTAHGALSHTAGQYAFLNVPSISPLQWHPFTISSSPADGFSSLHVKTMNGADSFTSQLHARAHAMDADGTPAAQMIVRVDGPYGVPPDLGDYDLVLLVAGGIGVTPCHSILHHLHSAWLAAQPSNGGVRGDANTCVDAGANTCGVRLVWSVRDEAMPKLFDSTWCAINANDGGGRFGYSIHNTQRARTPPGDAVPATPPTVLLAPSQASPSTALLQDQPRPPSSVHMNEDAANASSPVAIQRGRPKLPELLASYRRDLYECTASKATGITRTESAAGDLPTQAPCIPPSRVLIFACGPAALVRSASDAALEIGAHFHAEKFEL